jgi:hypothetical protein
MNGPKCVIATYNVVQKFKIPSGIDLEDEKQVSDWGVKWSTLTICLTNGKEIEIQPSYDVDMKRPYEQEIEDDEDFDVDDVDAPNCFPYKKCSVCEERKSCGNYDDNKVWFCEDCFVEEKEEDDEEEEGQNCRRCQTFVPDGEEHVAEGDCHAYCESCYDDLVQYCGIHLKCELEECEPNDDNKMYCPKCEKGE